MTPQQIDALPAGRELDALVLVHVCGWKWRRFEPSKLCALESPRRQRGDALVDWATESERFKDWDRVVHDFPPHVSIDIAAAWTVVEEMASHGNDVIIQHSRSEPGIWACEFNAGGVCDGSSLPLAICRAALNAVFAAKAQEEPCKT